jgi:hypothetical protein
MADRIEVPPDLASKVMYASDRQCCICRDGNTRVQIHHIDKHPSNNDWDNLAVICLTCHSEAHSKEAFVRNLSPDLISQYNQSWRALVTLRLNPSNDPKGLLEYRSEVFLEFSLNCHGWKIQYMTLYPGGFQDIDGQHFKDIWDAMIELGKHRYTEEEWARYRPLFVQGLVTVFANFDRTLSLYPEVLPQSFKTLMIRSRRRLDTAGRVYSFLPRMIAATPQLAQQADMMFKQQFVEVLQALRDLSREADSLRSTKEGAS